MVHSKFMAAAKVWILQEIVHYVSAYGSLATPPRPTFMGRWSDEKELRDYIDQHIDTMGETRTKWWFTINEPGAFQDSEYMDQLFALCRDILTQARYASKPRRTPEGGDKP